MSGATPRRLFRALATAEAITWALLLTGMVLKYTDVTELGVRVFGMIHGVVFIGYCIVTVVVAVDQRWSVARLVLGLGAAIPPFATLAFEAYADRHGLLGDGWASRSDSSTFPQRAVAWLIGHVALAALMFAGAVVALTAVALLVGPPVG